MNTTGCRVGCALDCPYCHVHVVDVYSHLAYAPCPRAVVAKLAWECCGTEPQPCPVHAGTGA